VWLILEVKKECERKKKKKLPRVLWYLKKKTTPKPKIFPLFINIEATPKPKVFSLLISINICVFNVAL
jgi:hypothetical protein